VLINQTVSHFLHLYRGQFPRHLKAIDPELPILLSSGFNEVEAIQRFTGKGLAGFIQKPYTAVALAEKVKAILLGPAPDNQSGNKTPKPSL
jgi:FixJ family two-component response regulator